MGNERRYDIRHLIGTVEVKENGGPLIRKLLDALRKEFPLEVEHKRQEDIEGVFIKVYEIEDGGYYEDRRA